MRKQLVKSEGVLVKCHKHFKVYALHKINSDAFLLEVYWYLFTNMESI